MKHLEHVFLGADAPPSPGIARDARPPKRSRREDAPGRVASFHISWKAEARPGAKVAISDPLPSPTWRWEHCGDFQPNQGYDEIHRIRGPVATNIQRLRHRHSACERPCRRERRTSVLFRAA